MTVRCRSTHRARARGIRLFFVVLLFIGFVGTFYGAMHIAWVGDWIRHPAYWPAHVTYGDGNDDLRVVLKLPEPCRLDLVYETGSEGIWSEPETVRGGGTFRHHALHLRDLAPFEDIRYRIVCDPIDAEALPRDILDDLERPRIISKNSIFDDSLRPLRFAVYGDNRPTAFGVGTHAYMIPALAKANPDFVIHVGDMVQWGDEEFCWSRFFHEGRELFEKTPLLPCPGNHEYYDPPDPEAESPEAESFQRCDCYLEAFHLPGEESFYARTVSNVHIISLDITKRRGARNPKIQARQMDWLDAHLAALSEAPPEWLILVFHNPVRVTVNDWSRVWSDVLGPVFDKYDVAIDLIFCGHVHQYERVYLDEARCWQIVAAGGGSEVHALKVGRPRDGSAVVELSHSYCIVEVTGPRLRVEARFMKGEPFDGQVAAEVDAMVLFQVAPYTLASVLFVLASLAAALRIVYGHAPACPEYDFGAGPFPLRFAVLLGAFLIAYLEMRNLITVTFPHQEGFGYLVRSNRILFAVSNLAISFYLIAGCGPVPSRWQGFLLICSGLLIAGILEIVLYTGEWDEKDYPKVSAGIYLSEVVIVSLIHWWGRVRWSETRPRWLGPLWGNAGPRPALLDSPFVSLAALVLSGIVCYLTWLDMPML